jgi:hypothetical protein
MTTNTYLPNRHVSLLPRPGYIHRCLLTNGASLHRLHQTQGTAAVPKSGLRHNFVRLETQRLVIPTVRPFGRPAGPVWRTPRPEVVGSRP